jgi:hypothetical protein
VRIKRCWVFLVIPMSIFSKWLAVSLAGMQLGAWAATTLQPRNDDEVLEVLPAVTTTRIPPTRLATGAAAPSPVVAAQLARQSIVLARQTGETRYWGRAQAALTPWWDRADAPVDVVVLQATVQQGRHEFDAARKVLTHALERTPSHAQGWLNLAALERISARYPQARSACEAVERAGQALYAAACRLETRSLQGEHAQATQGLKRLLEGNLSSEQKSWLFSLLAESQERAGADNLASIAYQRSLSLQSDLYTAIAQSDLLLRTGQPALALRALDAYPATDAVILRRATAWRRLGDARWQALHSQLQARTAELVRRGDDPSLHGRELALVALWLEDNPPRALQLARSNLQLQREPLDWWVAVQSAVRAGDTAAHAEITAAIAAAGLNDARLRTAQP